MDEMVLASEAEACEPKLARADSASMAPGGWWISRAKLVIGLCLLQLIAIPICVVLCAVEVETIVGSQAIALFGIAFAILEPRASARWFGSSVVVLTLVCWLLIETLGWGPGQAQRPITSLLIAATLVLVPLGLVALYETLTSRSLQTGGTGQFSLRTLMLVVLGTSVLAGVMRAVYLLVGDMQVALAVLEALAAWGATAAVFVVGFQKRRELGQQFDSLVEARRRFGSRLTTLREKRCVTRQELAIQCGWSERFQRRLESGDAEIRFDQLTVLAEALHEPPAELIK